MQPDLPKMEAQFSSRKSVNCDEKQAQLLDGGVWRRLELRDVMRNPPHFIRMARDPIPHHSSAATVIHTYNLPRQACPVPSDLGRIRYRGGIENVGAFKKNMLRAWVVFLYTQRRRISH